MVEQVSDAQRFRLYRPSASAVELVGNFTGWLDRPIRLHAEGDGWWSVRTELLPGDYEFHYLVDRHEWQTDFAASGVRSDDEFGWMSLLHVPMPVEASPGSARPRVEVRSLRPSKAA